MSDSFAMLIATTVGLWSGMRLHVKDFFHRHTPEPKEAHKKGAALYVFSLGTDFTGVAVGHGLEGRATAAKMGATR